MQLHCKIFLLSVHVLGFGSSTLGKIAWFLKKIAWFWCLDWKLVEYFSFSTPTIPLEILFKFWKKNWVQSFSRLHFLWISHQAILITIANLRVILAEGTFVTVSVHCRNLDLDVKFRETQIYHKLHACSWNNLYSSYWIFVSEHPANNYSNGFIGGEIMSETLQLFICNSAQGKRWNNVQL